MNTTIEQVAETAKEIMLQKGFHSPLIILEGRKGMNALPLEFPKDYDDRLVYMFFKGQAMKKGYLEGLSPRLEQVFVITEVWLANVKMDEYESDGFVPPSQHKDRIEALMVSQLKLPKGGIDVLVYNIIRNHKGDVVDLEPNELNKAVQGLKNGENGSIHSLLLEAFLKGYKSL